MQIEDILKSYGAMLGHIGYMLPEDVNRMITDGAQVSSDDRPQNIWCKGGEVYLSIICTHTFGPELPNVIIHGMCACCRLSTWLCCQTEGNTPICTCT